jgi:CRISPR-associated protein Cas1
VFYIERRCIVDKMTVVLDKKNITLSLDGKSLRIDCPGTPVQRVPLGMVGQIIVYGNPVVSCNVWRKLSEEGISAVLLPARGQGMPSWISPGLSTAIMVRINQYRAWSDIDIKTSAVALLLKAKIKGLLKLAEVLEVQVVFLQNSLSRIDEADNIDSMRGIEGAAAREWFGLMTEILSKKWQFRGRNRQPPRDPVNSLLSLGYTLLFSEIRKQVHLRGLDPCLGFLHSPYPGRESLVLDLAEPLRPGVDAFVLSLVEETLKPEDFTRGKKEGCRMTKEARGIFYPAWEDWKNNWSSLDTTENNTHTHRTLRLISKKFIDNFVRSWDIPENNTED